MSKRETYLSNKNNDISKYKKTKDRNKSFKITDIQIGSK